MSLAELVLPYKTGAMIAAIIRGEETKSSPAASFILEPGDVLVLVGLEKEIERAIRYLDEGKPSDALSDTITPTEPMD